MNIYNVPLKEDFFESFCNFFLKKHWDAFPNFSNFLIITASSSFSIRIKREFQKSSIILPSILSLSDVDASFITINGGYKFIVDFIEYTEVSDIKYHTILFDIVKEALPTLSNTGILNYINDFIEIENYIVANDLELLDLINKQQDKLANVASSVEASLSHFFLVLYNLQNYKNKNKILSRYQKNILFIKALTRLLPYLDYKEFYICGALGTNKVQDVLLTSCLNTAKSNIVLSGLELIEDINLNATLKPLLNLVNILQLGVHNVEHITYSSTAIKGEMFVKEYSDIPSSSSDVSMHILQILKESPNAKIGIISNEFDFANFLQISLKDLGLPFYTVFVRSIGDSAIFSLFKVFLELTIRFDIVSYINFLSNSLVSCSKCDVLRYKMEIANKNYQATLPFDIGQFVCEKGKTFEGFMLTILEIFQSTLTESVQLGDDFKFFQSFIQEICLEIGSFFANDYRVYIDLFNNHLKDTKYKPDSVLSNISILSPIEARFLKFDYLFITNLNLGIFPKTKKQNKIINNYLQDLLEIRKNEDDFAWFDFISFLYKSNYTVLSYTSSLFEEETALEPSFFLLHAIETFDIKPCNFEFIIDETSNYKLNMPMPKFYPNSFPSRVFVTAIEKLMNNPYDFYVNYILKAREEKEINQKLETNEIGVAFHTAIYHFFKYKNLIDDTLFKILKSKNRLEFYEFYKDQIVKIHNHFYLETLELESKSFVKQLMEEEILLPLKLSNIEFLLCARPDRIDFYEDKVNIIDYKFISGNINQGDIESGKKLQLGLEGMIIKNLFPYYKEEDINLYYYILDIKKGEVKKQQIHFQGVDFYYKMLFELFENIKFYNYRLDDKYKCSANLARIYDFL